MLETGERLVYWAVSGSNTFPLNEVFSKLLISIKTQLIINSIIGLLDFLELSESDNSRGKKWTVDVLGGGPSYRIQRKDLDCSFPPTAGV